MENSITPGSTFEVDYPFMRCEVEVMAKDSLELETIQSWKPGHQQNEQGDTFADGEGKMILDVVDVFQPVLRYDITGYPRKIYPKRVFYLRRFVTPDGVEFGKTGLKIAAEATFKRLAKRYMYDYAVADA